MWRTPNSQEPGITAERLNGELGHRMYDKETGRLAQVGLTQQVQLWQTPRVSSANGASESEILENNPKSRLETQVAIWNTPTTRDWKDTHLTENVPTNSLLGRQVLRVLMSGGKSSDSTKQLNP